MISSVPYKLGKKTHKLKFSTRALIRLEAEHDGRAFSSILEDILIGTGVTLVASVLAAVLDDGKGVDQEEALDLIDQAGGYRNLMAPLSEAINVAFPEVKKAIEAAQEKADADADDQGKAEPPADA
ncbi:hypothetical protein [Leisingera sp. ANG-M6]|uniref:hypothetical protein n=1 Tax=Leisingera sp. ANG-M6 TaxID=1577900 RepID=UPI00057D5FA0|nr:hypothetical protein [Leisingera sp. ANG-M6]KIC30053.1 hypothetical protein RA24_03675 [Leisingera sp. ANG-M6]